MTSVSLPRLALRGNAGQFALLVAPEQLPWARTTLTDGRPDPDLRPSGRQFLPVAGRVPPGLALLASSR